MMANLEDNVVVMGWSGAFGEQVVLRHMRDGSTVLDEEDVREKGEGVRGAGDCWKFASSADGNILAELCPYFRFI